MYYKNIKEKGFRKPEPKVADPFYYICGGKYTEAEIEEMTWNEFCLRRLESMPRKLYKYFSNKVIDGNNYSLQSLLNGTVYLQEVSAFDDNYDCTLSMNEEEFVKLRIIHYAEHCGVQVDERWEYSRIVSEFSAFLNNKIQQGISIESVFGGEELSNIEDYYTNSFALMLYLTWLENLENENAWKIAFYKALHKEFCGMLNVTREYRVACFTTSPYMINMWSNQYANNNQGFCVEYEIPDYTQENKELLMNLFPVIYCDARKDILNKCSMQFNRELDEKYLEVIYKYGILAKNKSIWQDQDEWRLVSYKNMLAKDYNCKFFPISKVYLGTNMQKDQRKEIIDICKERAIPYVGIIRSHGGYKLMECSQKCEECERSNT